MLPRPGEQRACIGLGRDLASPDHPSCGRDAEIVIGGLPFVSHCSSATREGLDIQSAATRF